METNNQTGSLSEIIVAQEGAKKYVKKLFQITRYPYRLKKLNHIDIYYEYPEEFIELFDEGKTYFFVGNELLNFDQSLNFQIKTKIRKSIKIDAVLIRNACSKAMRVQVFLVTPKERIYPLSGKFLHHLRS